MKNSLLLQQILLYAMTLSAGIMSLTTAYRNHLADKVSGIRQSRIYATPEQAQRYTARLKVLIVYYPWLLGIGFSVFTTAALCLLSIFTLGWK